jgi:hypothetical protein
MDYTVYMGIISVFSSAFCIIASLLLRGEREKEDKATLDNSQDAQKGNVV